MSSFQIISLGLLSVGMQLHILESFLLLENIFHNWYEACPQAGPSCLSRLPVCVHELLGPATLKPHPASESLAQALLTHPHMAPAACVCSLFLIIQIPGLILQTEFADWPSRLFSFSFECLQNFISSTHRVLLGNAALCLPPNKHALST